VEGYELEVLRSASKMLSDPNLQVVVEIHKNRVSMPEVVDLLSRHGKKVQQEFHAGSIVTTLLFG